MTELDTQVNVKKDFTMLQNQCVANGENMIHVGAWHRSVTCCGWLMDCT